MPSYSIRPIDSPRSHEVSAESIGDVFSHIRELSFNEAEVLRDGVYDFSLRLEEQGGWCLFHKDGEISTIS